jgi:glyoxylase-like metal-dependent hydrolase (beta-lactamase superfamily II)
LHQQAISSKGPKFQCRRVIVELPNRAYRDPQVIDRDFSFPGAKAHDQRRHRRIRSNRRQNMATIPQTQIPGIYHRRIGDIVVTALSDGYFDTTGAALRGIEPADAAVQLEAAFQPAHPRVSINCFLIWSAGRIALIDTGAGDTMGPTLGKLPQTLAALGITRADIDTVLLSHMHPDHSNGLTGSDGTALFPHVDLVVSDTDTRHWNDDAARARATTEQQTRYFDGARLQLAPYKGRLKHAGGEVFPGVTAMPLPGHTPGHTGYVVASGNETLLIWGDVCHVPALQMPNPDITMAFDSDGPMAAATRRRVLDWVSTDRLLVAGMHLHFPGFAHVMRRGDGYEAVQESWRF